MALFGFSGFIEWTSMALRRFFVGTPAGTRSMGGLSEAGESIDESSALSISAAWACVNLVAGTGGSLPILPCRMVNGMPVPARDHWSYRLLNESPNDEQSPIDFWEGAYASLELKGNALAEKVMRPDGTVIALIPVPWSSVSVSRGVDGTLVYRWGAQSRTSSEVLHIRGFGGAAEGGLSTLAYARNTLGLARAMERQASGMFANGLRPSGVLKLKDWMSEEKRATLDAVMQERFSGAINAGRPMILEGGTEWQALTMNPEDAQMLESRKFSIEEMCRFFGVPPSMIGHTEKTTSFDTGLARQLLGFEKFTMRRRITRVEQSLTKQVLTAADRAAGIRIRVGTDELLRTDTAARGQWYRDMTSIGALTINEVRAREGMMPVEGGDVVRLQMQYQPIAGSVSIEPSNNSSSSQGQP